MVKKGDHSQRILIPSPSFAISVDNTWTQSLILQFGKALMMDVKRHCFDSPLQGRSGWPRCWNCYYRMPSVVNPPGIASGVELLCPRWYLRGMAHIQKREAGLESPGYCNQIGTALMDHYSSRVSCGVGLSDQKLSLPMTAPLLPLPSPAYAPFFPQVLILRTFPSKYSVY